MNRSELGVGIIGTGSIVHTYAKCIGELEETKLVALYTRSSKRINEAEKIFGAPVFDDIDAFLDLPELSLVCVCNKSGEHSKAISQSAKTGKHVLCEKPLDVTTEKIDEAIAVCHEHNVLLGGVFQNRCTEAYRLVEKMVREEKLGKLLMGNAHINWYRNSEYYSENPWRGTKRFDGGAAFINQGIHTIDLLMNLMGPVTAVFGNMRTLVHDIEGEDVGNGVLNFSNGAIGTITAGTALFPGYPERLEIYGEKGSILMEGGQITAWNVQGVPAPDLMTSRGNSSGASDPTSIGHLNHKLVIEDMVNAIKENRSPMVGGAEARKAVEVITALYRSSMEEKLIVL